MKCVYCPNTQSWLAYVIPADAWATISPTGDADGGRICIECASSRLAALGMRVKAELSVSLPGIDAFSGHAFKSFELIECHRAKVADLRADLAEAKAIVRDAGRS